MDRGAPEADLKPARALDVLDMPLSNLLDWREDGQHVVDAARRGLDRDELGVVPEPRTACGLYVRFLLGLRGVAVVGHGSSGPLGIANQIRLAARSVSERAVQRTEELIGSSGVGRTAIRAAKESGA